MKCPQYLLILCLFLSCAKETTAEQVEKAIRSARIYLTSDECDKAISELEEYKTSQATNSFFVQTLASAYACRSGYSEITLLLDDLPNIDTTSGGFIRSLVQFTSSSSMDAVDNADYLDLQGALEYIHQAGFGSTNPTAADRSAIFGSTGANNINIQILLMSLVQLGKYYYYYGNPDATGIKGAGADPNNCMIGYTDALAQAAITGNVAGTKGLCSIAATGHVDLPIATPATSIPRLCETLVVFNNMLDLLGSISFGSGSSHVDLSSIETPIDALFTITDGLGYTQVRTVSELRRQDDCETYGLANVDEIQQYFALILETVYQ